MDWGFKVAILTVIAVSKLTFSGGSENTHGDPACDRDSSTLSQCASLRPSPKSFPLEAVSGAAISGFVFLPFYLG